MNKKNILLITLAALVVAGCDNTDKAASHAKAEDFYKQKYSTVLTYDQTAKKMAYLECVAAQKEKPTKEGCHEPDFLKK